jgi:hypothetical protein
MRKTARAGTAKPTVDGLTSRDRTEVIRNRH